MKVSVIIKALNEEKNIQRSIESALEAVAEVGQGEVILADSLSTDSTIELASRYPIKIVQLDHPEDRSCGIGAELGYKIALGEYIYILDADMVFFPGFLPAAIKELEESSKLAGVAGMVQEMNVGTLEFQERYKRKNSGLNPGDMDSLDMGGLYKKEALKDVGYFTNRNLNSYEEFELGCRLKSKGWHLKRIALKSVKHYGHQVDDYSLILKRVKSGYIFGVGELVRSALGKGHFKQVLTNLKSIKLYVVYIFWVFSLLIMFLLVFLNDLTLIAPITLLSLPFLVMIFKKKSLQTGVYSVIASSFNAFGLLIGFFKKKKSDPLATIDFKVLK